jgi:hypothetical protein
VNSGVQAASTDSGAIRSIGVPNLKANLHNLTIAPTSVAFWHSGTAAALIGVI